VNASIAFAEQVSPVRATMPGITPALLIELMRHADNGMTMKYYVGQNAELMADTIWQAAAQSQSCRTG
jgi:hypothetical protein